MDAWIRHPRSKQPDAALTIAVYATVVVLFRFLFSNISLGPLSFGNLDSTVIASILTPCLGVYGWRKHSDSPDKITEIHKNDKPKEQQTPEKDDTDNV